jgi:predicted phosphodiesterase
MDIISPYKGGSSILVMSDIHFDSIDCDRRKLKYDLDNAKEKKVPIIIIGDLFDAMGAKFDPRTGKKDIRKEYCNGNYFDSIVADAVRFFKNYDIKFVSTGNHEISVSQRHELSLLNNFALGMKLEGREVLIGDYTGFIKFKFEIVGRGNINYIKTLYYTHGSGGNSPVTKGVIGASRRSSMIDADIICSGHLHSDWEMTNEIIYIDNFGNIKHKTQLHFQTSTYKKAGDWEKSKGFGNSYIGCRELCFKHERYRENKDYYEDIKYSTIRV